VFIIFIAFILLILGGLWYLSSSSAVATTVLVPVSGSAASASAASVAGSVTRSYVGSGAAAAASASASSSSAVATATATATAPTVSNVYDVSYNFVCQSYFYMAGAFSLLSGLALGLYVMLKKVAQVVYCWVRSLPIRERFVPLVASGVATVASATATAVASSSSAAAPVAVAPPVFVQQQPLNASYGAR